MSIFRKLFQYFDSDELDEICPGCDEKITTYKYREVYKPYDGHGGIALHTYCLEKYVSTIESAAKKVYDYQVEEVKKEEEKVWKEAMASPIDPVLKDNVARIVKSLHLTPKRHSKYLVRLAKLGFITYI